MNEGKAPCWRPCLIDIQSRTLSTLTYLMSQPSYLQDVSRLLRLPEKPVPELDPYQKCISLCPDDLIIHNPHKVKHGFKVFMRIFHLGIPIVICINGVARLNDQQTTAIG